VRHVVGTAGHVDHGKSTLVLALTGTDPDRLAEEKRRGMTIELGFAEWTLPSGDRVGVIDVPGHQRFVRTMVAGAQGIDLVLLVVAADEGVMPQTREHLTICELLGTRHGVVALTKRDLVDGETLELARAEVGEALGRTALRDAPVVACSAVTREGLGELAATVEGVLAAVPPPADRGRPRLFIDRAFSLAGFGPVVTGTLEGGSFRGGDEVVVLPSGERARVRGLQRHGATLGTAEPGGRTAVNLAGIELGHLARGMALAAPGTVAPTRRLDVRLRVSEDSPIPVRHASALSVHLGTCEVPARCWLLTGTELAPGAAGYAQLQLATPIPAAPGDRFVVRRPTPGATLGGGDVLDVAPRRHRRHDAAVATALGRREAAGLATLVQEELAKHRAGAELAVLVRAAGAGPRQVERALTDLGGEALALGRRWIDRQRWRELGEASTAALTAFHDAEPLQQGMPREEWRGRLRLGAAAAADAAHRLAAEGAIEERGALLALPGRGREVPAAARELADGIARQLADAALDPPPISQLRAAGLTPQLLRMLVDEGAAVPLAGDVVLGAAAYAAARERIVAHLREHGSATVGELRDVLGATRRVVVPLLESLDAARVTVRTGDLRRLRAGSQGRAGTGS